MSLTLTFTFKSLIKKCETFCHSSCFQMSLVLFMENWSFRNNVHRSFHWQNEHCRNLKLAKHSCDVFTSSWKLQRLTVTVRSHFSINATVVVSALMLFQQFHQTLRHNEFGEDALTGLYSTHCVTVNLTEESLLSELWVCDDQTLKHTEMDVCWSH